MEMILDLFFEHLNNLKKYERSPDISTFHSTFTASSNFYYALKGQFVIPTSLYQFSNIDIETQKMHILLQDLDYEEI